MDCTKLQVFKDGVCISESLGKCRGCQDEFIDDLKAKFNGVVFKSNGEKVIL